MSVSAAGRGWETILPYIAPLVRYVEDSDVSEIMVNPSGRIFIERAGLLRDTCENFAAAQLEAAVVRIARDLGSDISARQPILETRLPDGSRVAAVMPPCSVGGITLTIRKFQYRRYGIQDLVNAGSLTATQFGVLREAVESRRNILISGGTGSGKTTLLNALAALIPPDQRIILIEDVNEIQVDLPNVVRLEARREQTEMPAVTIAQLLRVTLRLRPDRIILGEVRGAEAYEVLQALNTGHAGSLSTLQADTAKQATDRLTTCVLQRGGSLDHRYIRSWIASAVHLLVHLQRDAKSGLRTVTEILALNGYDLATDRYQFTAVG
jgi:pilus assembly protein CpaF